MRGLAIALAAGYLGLAFTGGMKEHPAVWCSLYALLYGGYLLATRAILKNAGSVTLKEALWAALAFRLILLPVAPTLSDDLWRYLWEGRVQLHGFNPYAHAPSDPALAALRDENWEGINYKDLPAIYPPVSQWANAAGAALGWGPAGVKAVFVGADMMLAWLLAALLKARGHAPGRVLIYAWNPLAVVEVAGSGHNDPLAVCLLLATMVGIIGSRPLLSTLALGLSGGAKFLPLAFAPLIYTRGKAARIPAVFAVTAACFLPYLSAGPELFFSARQYAERWRSNESLFAILEGTIAATGVSAPLKAWVDARGYDSLYTQSHMLARAAAALIAAVLLGALARRVWMGRMQPERGIYLFTGSVLLLAPVLHPWYLIWILPWMALRPSPAWLALAALAPLAYLEAEWVRWVEYLPFFGLLLLPWLARRRRA